MRHLVPFRVNLALNRKDLHFSFALCLIGRIKEITLHLFRQPHSATFLKDGDGDGNEFVFAAGLLSCWPRAKGRIRVRALRSSSYLGFTATKYQ